VNTELLPYAIGALRVIRMISARIKTFIFDLGPTVMLFPI
jgi:hypothetical protein